MIVQRLIDQLSRMSEDAEVLVDIGDGNYREPDVGLEIGEDGEDIVWV